MNSVNSLTPYHQHVWRLAFGLLITFVLLSMPVPAAASKLIEMPVAGKGTIRADKLDHSEAAESDASFHVRLPDSSAVPVVPQPEGNDRFVSNRNNELTLYEPAFHNGVTGLLAHNYLAGSRFYELELGQILWVYYTPQKAQAYEVVSANSYQRLRQREGSDTYVRLEDRQELSTADVFAQIYLGTHRLVLQTCLENDGDLSWGLYFVIAQPLYPKSHH